MLHNSSGCQSRRMAAGGRLLRPGQQKNSASQYVGFRRFFAMISKGPKGDYIKGQIEHIDGIPTSGNGGGGEPGLTQENCKEWGYTDFSGAT